MFVGVVFFILKYFFEFPPPPSTSDLSVLFSPLCVVADVIKFGGVLCYVSIENSPFKTPDRRLISILEFFGCSRTEGANLASLPLPFLLDAPSVGTCVWVYEV